MDYDKIMSDRKLFNETVYTPLTEAIKILEERQKNPDLIKKIETLLDNNIPEPLKKIDKYAISAKQVATPNFDTRWFLKLAKEFQLKPFFSEYFDDKFTSNNSFKHSLGQLLIYNDINRKGENIREKVKIVDFDKYDGKPIKNVKTIWGESLIDFHKGLFNVYGYNLDEFILYDASDLLKKNGSKAERYYVKDLLLLVCHGILFENFLLDGRDGEFTRNILLPAIKETEELSGLKPLIVPIPPMDIESDDVWFSYDKKIKSSNQFKL